MSGMSSRETPCRSRDFRDIFPDIRMIGNMSEGRFFVHDRAAAKRQLCRRRDSLPAILPPILGKLAGIAKLLPAADFAAGYPAVHNFADFARLVILRLIKRMRQTFPEICKEQTLSCSNVSNHA